MNRFIPSPSLSRSPLLLLVASTLAFTVVFTVASAGCAPTICASDSDCAEDFVCLIDGDGPHCTAIELAARVSPEGDADGPRFGVDDGDGDDDGEGNGDGDGDAPHIVLRDATLSFTPAARTASIVMRPISVVVMRPPSGATATAASLTTEPTRSKP